MNKLRTLDVVLTEYTRAEELAKKDLDSVPVTSRPGWGIAIRQAKDKLPSLRAEYLTRILKNSVGFFVDGDDAKALKFSEIAAKNGAFVVDAAAIFNALADKVQASIGGRKEFSVTQISLLDSALKDLLTSAGYDGRLERVTMASLQVVSTRERLVSYIRELVVNSNGFTASVIAAQSALLAQALKDKFDGKVLVVVVRNASSVDRAGLAGLFTRTAKVDVDAVDEIDERFARDTIMGVLKPAKPAPTPTKQPEPKSPVEPKTNQEQE